MHKIIIGFSRPIKTKIGSSLIMLLEETNFSHTFLDTGDYIYQECVPSMSKTKLCDFLDHNKIVESFVIYVTDDQFSDIIDFCEECLVLHVPYGKLQIVGMGLIRMINQLGCKFKNPCADGPKTMVCSEFIGYVLRIIGVCVDVDQLELEGPKLIYRTVKELSKQSSVEKFANVIQFCGKKETKGE